MEEDRAAEGREEVDGVSRKTLTRFMASGENSAREREKENPEFSETISGGLLLQTQHVKILIAGILYFVWSYAESLFTKYRGQKLATND